MGLEGDVGAELIGAEVVEDDVRLDKVGVADCVEVVINVLVLEPEVAGEVEVDVEMGRLEIEVTAGGLYPQGSRDSKSSDTKTFSRDLPPHFWLLFPVHARLHWVSSTLVVLLARTVPQ